MSDMRQIPCAAALRVRSSCDRLIASKVCMGTGREGASIQFEQRKGAVRSVKIFGPEIPVRYIRHTKSSSMKKQLTLLILFALSAFFGTSCSKEKLSAPETPISIGTPKSAGPFVYKMNHHQGGCPTSGQGCAKKAKSAISPAVLSEFDAAIRGGAPGLKTFFTTGSWQSLFPALNTTDPVIYGKLSSGSFEGRKTAVGTTTTYLFGTIGFQNANASYMFALVD